jgi:hypothetical protein
VDSSPFLRVWQIHRHFLILLCNVIYRLLSSSFLQLDITYHLRPSYAHYSSQTSVNNRLQFICYLCSHFPYFAPIQQYQFNITIKYMYVSLHQYIFILPQRYNSTTIPFAFLIRAWTSRSAPPSSVTTLPRYVNCLTLSITILFTFIFVVIFEFIRSVASLFSKS